MAQMRVLATEVQVGDKVIDLSEVDYIVRQVERRPGSPMGVDVDSVGGWVSLTGDTKGGYFKRLYGGEEDYYAYPTEMITIER